MNYYVEFDLRAGILWFCSVASNDSWSLGKVFICLPVGLVCVMTGLVLSERQTVLGLNSSYYLPSQHEFHDS